MSDDYDYRPRDEAGRYICGAEREAGPCRADAGAGTDHFGWGRCKRHMGNTPSVAGKAFRQMARAMGEPVRMNAADAIAETIAATAGHVFWLQGKVDAFRFQEKTKLDTDGVEVEIDMTPNQKSWWKLYGEERDRLVKYGEVAIRAGLAERTVRLAEAQGEALAQIVDRILDGLRLTDEQLLLVPDVVPAAFRGLVIDQRPPEIEGGQ